MKSFVKFIIVVFSLLFSHFSYADEKLESAEKLKPNADSGTILTIEDAEVEEIEKLEEEKEEKTEDETDEDEEQTETAPIDISVADTIGIYDEQNGGVNSSYWQGRTYENIYNVLKNINISTTSPAYNRGIRNIILSKTSVPNPISSESVGKIAKLKVDLLIKAGRFDEAKALIQKMPLDIKNHLFSKQLVKMALVDFDNSLACSTLNGQTPQAKKKAFWVVTELVCLTIGHDGLNQEQKSVINEKINNAQSANIELPDGVKELILYYVFNQEINEKVKIKLNPWTLNLMRLIGVGVEIDQSDLTDMYIKRGILLNAQIDDYTRLKLAEELFITEGLPIHKLYQVYNSLKSGFVVEKIANPETGEEKYPSAYQRYLEYKALLSLKSYEKPQYIIDLVAGQDGYGEKIKLIRIFAPMLKGLTPYSSKTAVKVAKMFYAIGDYETANAWGEKNEVAMWFELALSEPINPSINPVEFNQGYGVFEGFETQVEEQQQDLFSSIFGGNNPSVTEQEKKKNIKKVNQNPLAEDVKKRKSWMLHEFKSQKVKGASGLRMGAVFAMLEAVGYEISDASWLYASQKSTYVESRVLSPAKSKALQIYTKTAKDPTHILIVARQFVDKNELSDSEFAKVMNILYRAGFENIVRDIMLERAVLYL